MDDQEIQLLDDLELNHFWYRARKLQLSSWFSQFNEPLLVLDLGSASGGNTLHISSMGHSVTSIEYSSLGVELQRKKGIEVMQADARNLPCLDSYFDIVICLDVLEHIPEDYQVVSEISRVLKPNGKFLISVPEDPKLWSAHDDAVNHLRRYSKVSLLRLIETSGLKYHRIWSTLIFLRPAIIVARKFSKGSSLQPLSPFINSILFLICKFELLLPRLKQKGTTIWLEGTR